MKISFSPADRLQSTIGTLKRGPSLWVWLAGVGLPLIAILLVMAGWYIVTGESLTDLWGHDARPESAHLNLSETLAQLPESARKGGAPVASVRKNEVEPGVIGPGPLPPGVAPPPPGLRPLAGKEPSDSAAPAPDMQAGQDHPAMSVPSGEGKTIPPEGGAATDSHAAHPGQAAESHAAEGTAGHPPAAAHEGETAASVEATPPQPVLQPLPPPPFMPEPAIPKVGTPQTPPPTFGSLSARSDLAPLPDAPKKSLLKQESMGLVPVRDGDDSPQKRYARPAKLDPSLTKVALVVVGLGLSPESTDAAINKLPSDVTLSFSPYAGGLETWIRKARAAGHETLVDLPLEPPGYPDNDAGELSILARHTPSEAHENLLRVLARAPASVGVAAALHSPTVQSPVWSTITRDLRSRGLLLVGDGYSGVPLPDLPDYAPVGLVIDETPFKDSIDTRFVRLQAAAQRDGQAIGYMTARPLTFVRLLTWLSTLPAQKMMLVPVSALARSPQG